MERRQFIRIGSYGAAGAAVAGGIRERGPLGGGAKKKVKAGGC